MLYATCCMIQPNYATHCLRWQCLSGMRDTDSTCIIYRFIFHYLYDPDPRQLSHFSFLNSNSNSIENWVWDAWDDVFSWMFAESLQKSCNVWPMSCCPFYSLCSYLTKGTSFVVNSQQVERERERERESTWLVKPAFFLLLILRGRGSVNRPLTAGFSENGARGVFRRYPVDHKLLSTPVPLGVIYAHESLPRQPSRVQPVVVRKTDFTSPISSGEREAWALEALCNPTLLTSPFIEPLISL